MTNNERVVQIARSYVGLQAATDLRRFDRLLGEPYGWDLSRPFRIVGNRVEGISTCAMVAIAFLREAGARCAQGRYRVSAGLSDQIRAALLTEPYGALVTPGGGRRPEPGDVLEQLPTQPGGSTHVLTVVGWDGDVLVSVDGGQVGKRGLQAIFECERVWTNNRLAGREVRWISTRLLEFFDDAA